jgi:hypothetical protein
MISEIFPSLSYMFHETFMSAGSGDVKQLSTCSSKVGASLVRKHETGNVGARLVRKHLTGKRIEIVT